MHDDVVRFLDDPESKVRTAKPAVDADHGRIETRTATVSTDINWLQEDHHWPGLAAIGKVMRIRGNPGQNHDRDGLLPDQHSALQRMLQRGCALPLGCRKPPALAAGCRDERGPGQEPVGQRPAQSRPAAAHGFECHAKGRNQRFVPRASSSAPVGTTPTSRAFWHCFEMRLPCCLQRSRHRLLAVAAHRTARRTAAPRLGGQSSIPLTSRTNAATSTAYASGCSSAAKCPPRSNSLNRTRL